MGMGLSKMEEICFNTVRIEAFDVSGNHSLGTGFFFNLEIDEDTVPLIVTNKHVVKGMTRGKFVLTECDKEGYPIYNKHFPITFNSDFEKRWIMHPDPQIDICVLPISPIMTPILNQAGKSFFFRAFNNNHIPSVTQLEEVDIAEEILMIGYPNGLWDSYNNMPLVRRGIVATKISLNHRGKREFVIDAACFPGSSGSPVILFNKGGYTDKNGNLNWGNGRLMLLGVLYAGPQLTVTGEVQIVTIPNVQQKAMSVSHIPNNLGYIIKADTILDFIPIIKPLLKNNVPTK